jgi:hypothetical protein
MEYEHERQVLSEIHDLLDASGLELAMQGNILASILVANAQADGVPLNELITFFATKATILYSKEGSTNAK